MHFNTFHFIATCWILVSCCSLNAQAYTSRVSPSVLYQMFGNIYEATGIFPISDVPTKNFTIVNAKSNKCLDIKFGEYGGLYTNLIAYTCSDHANNQAVWLKNAGHGYVILDFVNRHCAGSGYDVMTGVYLTPSPSWCLDSPSHQVAMLQYGDHVLFEQRESRHCISTVKGEDLVTDNCDPKDTAQQWKICTGDQKKCWPAEA